MGSNDQNQPKSIASPLAFNSVLDPSNPVGFFESAFHFASQTTDVFDDSQVDAMEKRILSLLEDIKKKKRENITESSEDQDHADNKKRLRILDGNDIDDDHKPIGTEPKPNKNNGLDMGTYSWTQTLGEIVVEVPVPFGTKKKVVICDIKSKSLRVGVKGQPLLIDGELVEAVKVCDSFWSLQGDDATITILLSKCNQWEWWKSVVKGDPEIDTGKCEPAGRVRRLDGLGYEAERHMRKLLFDYGQKCKGLPTSEDCPQVLKKFIADHPYLNLPQTNT